MKKPGALWLAGALSTAAITGVLLARGSDEAISACAQKNGGMLRLLADGETCRQSEVPVQWSVTGPAGPAGPQGAPGIPGEPGAPGNAANVVDSFGQVFGILVPGPSADSVVRVVNGTPYLMDIRPTGPVASPGSLNLWFETTNCTGTAYVSAATFNTLRLVQRAMLFEGTLYDFNHPAQSITTGSRFSQSFSGVTTCTVQTLTNFSVRPVEPFDLTAGFTAPYSVALQ